MTECSFDTPRRGLKFYAILPAPPGIMRLWRGLFPGRHRDHARYLSDHLARDIGLGPNDMARHRHVWPSESTGRPPI